MRPSIVLLALLLIVAPAFAGCLSPGDVEDVPGGDAGMGGEGADGGSSAAFANVSWQAGEPAPAARTEVTAARVGSTFLVVGGYVDGMVATNRVDAYDAEADRWGEAADYPIPVHHGAAVAWNGSVLVLGGYTTSAFVPTDLAFRYDPAEDAWAPIARLPEARGAHGAAVVGDRVHLVGGVGTDGDLLATVQVYDARNDTWSDGPEFPMPRDHLAVTAHEGVVYAVGGREQSFATNTPRVDALHVANGSWSRVPDMPTARGGLAAAIVRGHVVAVGGEEAGGTFPQVEAYDPRAGAWVTLPDLPTPRHGLAVGELGGELVTLLGGPEPGFTTSDAVERLG